MLLMVDAITAVAYANRDRQDKIDTKLGYGVQRRRELNAKHMEHCLMLMEDTEKKVNHHLAAIEKEATSRGIPLAAYAQAVARKKVGKKSVGNKAPRFTRAEMAARKKRGRSSLVDCVEHAVPMEGRNKAFRPVRSQPASSGATSPVNMDIDDDRKLPAKEL
jgi:hypothetical protein